jgi:uncharacterized protein (DUF362 family)
MSHEEHKPIGRREFLIRGASAAAGIAAVGAIGWRLFTSQPPQAHPAGATAALPDYAIPGLSPSMSIITGADRVKTVNRALAALGGIEAFVKKGDRVALKVNAAFASPPSLGATTNPQLVAEVARLCLAAGAASVVVLDNPINDPATAFALTGISAAAASVGAKPAVPRASDFTNVTLPGGKLLRNWPALVEPLRNVNKLIGIAPVKHHERAGASMSLKNWYGLLGGARNRFHQDVNTVIVELALLARPTLVILDGTQTLATNGPTGGSPDDLRDTRTMIVSTDGVAADAFGATLLGRKASELPYIVRAAAAGAGTADYESLKPRRGETD